jgi:hypothetical protein
MLLQFERGVRCIRKSLELPQDLADIQISQRHQSEYDFQSLAVGVLGVVLGVQTERNTLLHTVGDIFHQKVKGARMSENACRESMRESLRECFREGLREGLWRVCGEFREGFREGFR